MSGVKDRNLSYYGNGRRDTLRFKDSVLRR